MLQRKNRTSWWLQRPRPTQYIFYPNCHSQNTKSFRKKRSNKKGGGVICYVKSTLAAIKIEKQDAGNYDSVYVEITHNNKKLILATVCRPTKLQAADDTALYNRIQSLLQGKNAIVIGDFNCANVDRRLLMGNQEGRRLISMVYSFLTEVVTQQTTENNILDLGFVSDPDLFPDCKAEENLNGCDYNIIRFNVCVQHKLEDQSYTDSRLPKG